MCPLVRVDDVAVRQANARVKSLALSHRSRPQIGELEREIAPQRCQTLSSRRARRTCAGFQRAPLLVVWPASFRRAEILAKLNPAVRHSRNWGSKLA